MNREIRFRGKRKSDNQWIYGYYVDTNDIPRIIYEDSECMYMEEEVIPESVGEYTGLKDKKGTEIYEGDIVCEDDMFSICSWINEVGAYAFVPIESYPCETKALFEEYGTDTFFKNDVPSVFVTVVGNIYENPELLEVK